MKKIAALCLVLLAVVLTGCGGEPDGKKEIKAMHEKYIHEYNQVFLESRTAGKSKDWSQEIIQKAEKCKNKIEAIEKNIENEKVPKKAEAYKTSLKKYYSNTASFLGAAANEIRYKLENKPAKEREAIRTQAKEGYENSSQLFYELENEYSKAINGRPASVMGVNDVNYLAYTASDVNIAVIEAKMEKGAVGSNPYLQKKPLGVFMIFKIFVKNNQKDAITVDTHSFKLVDNQKREFSSSKEAELALRADLGDTKGVLTQLNPGMGTDFTVIFDVPPELNRYNTQLVAQGGFTGKAVTMPIYPVKIKQVKQ